VASLHRTLTIGRTGVLDVQTRHSQSGAAPLITSRGGDLNVLSATAQHAATAVLQGLIG